MNFSRFSAFSAITGSAERKNSLQMRRFKTISEFSHGLERSSTCQQPSRTMQARYKLVVLSNGDPDMLESAKHYHGIPFNRVISVAEAGSFKPHVATYTTAAK